MADSYSCNINTDPNAAGNMYFRGTWEYCPEYKTGDVVLHNGVMYLCIKHHAGKEPALTGNAEYWHKIASSSSGEPEKPSRVILDGGFASTSAGDTYQQTDLAGRIDGGSSSSRVTVPLI